MGSFRGDRQTGVLTRTVIRDAGEHAARLDSFRQVYHQLSPGKYHGQLDTLSLEGLQIFREARNQTVFERGSVEDGHFAIGLPARTEPNAAPGWFCGSEIGAPQRLLCTADHAEFLLRTPAGFDILGLSISCELMHRLLRLEGYPPELLATLGSRTIDTEPARAQALRAVMREALDEPSEAIPAPGCSATLGTAGAPLEYRILRRLINALAPVLGWRTPAKPRGNRARVVREAIDYLHAHPDRPLAIEDLCLELGVSRRTLQYCFEEALQVNPARYFRLWRLNAVRRELMRPSGRRKQVSEVASRWGFGHLPRFAGDYRDLFGELPSQTLSAQGPADTR